MIDWQRRLANEEPLLRWCIEQTHAGRVLDAACGTGRHLERLASWNLDVHGADISEGMLAAARQRLAHLPALTLTQRGFEAPIPAQPPLDLILCIGNSLALAPTLQQRRDAVSNFLAAVRPGGGVLIHVMNLWRMPEGPTTWQKSCFAELSTGRRLIMKGVHRCNSSGYIDLIVADPAAASQVRTDSIEFHGITRQELEQWARAAGAAEITFFGDYGRKAYAQAESPDLILFARR